MKKLKLSQYEIDKIVTVDRRIVPPTVYGVGFNDVGFQVTIKQRACWQYQLWSDMLKICFSEVSNDSSLYYNGVTCCDEWLSFANFFGWVNDDVNYRGRNGKCVLTKSILVKGNKHYSPELCSVIPLDVNMVVVNSDVASIGAYYCTKLCKYAPSVRYFGRKKVIGHYNTQEEAFAAYKTAKEAQIRAVANQYKDVLKPAVYESLMNWEIWP